MPEGNVNFRGQGRSEENVYFVQMLTKCKHLWTFSGSSHPDLLPTVQACKVTTGSLPVVTVVLPKVVMALLRADLRFVKYSIVADVLRKNPPWELMMVSSATNKLPPITAPINIFIK